jgi:hypothetical protein
MSSTLTPWHISGLAEQDKIWPFKAELKLITTIKMPLYALRNHGHADNPCPGTRNTTASMWLVVQFAEGIVYFVISHCGSSRPNIAIAIQIPHDMPQQQLQALEGVVESQFAGL